MFSLDQMPPKIEKIMDNGMGTQKSLCLPLGLEPSHPALPYPGRLMRLFSPIILILLGTVDRLRDQFPMRDAIASQFICQDLPGLPAMASQ